MVENPYTNLPEVQLARFGDAVVDHIGDSGLHSGGGGVDFQPQIDVLQSMLDGLQLQVNGHTANSTIHGGGGGGGGVVGFDSGVRHVNPVGGSDDYDGFHPWSAKATIQAAYDSLPGSVDGVLGGGVLELAPGRHDVGVGFVKDPIKHVHMRGYTVGGQVTTSGGGPFPRLFSVVYSSQPDGLKPEALITHGLNSGANDRGAFYEGVTFEMTSPEQKYAVRADDTNSGRVSRCNFWHTNPPADAYAIRADLDQVGKGGAEDTSWWRIIDCSTRGIGLCHLGKPGSGTTGTNRSAIRDNRVFGVATNNPSVGPAIRLDRAHGCMVEGNDISNFGTGILFASDSWMCTAKDNYGEGVNVFVHIDDSRQCTSWNNGRSVAGSDPSNRHTLLTNDAQDCFTFSLFHTASNNLYARNGYEDATTNRKNNYYLYGDLSRLAFKHGPFMGSNGQPEGLDYGFGQIGSMFINMDATASPAGKWMWRKTSGAQGTNTGWVEVSPPEVGP